jgi:solute carrier family 25, member 42
VWAVSIAEQSVKRTRGFFLFCGDGTTPVTDQEQQVEASNNAAACRNMKPFDASTETGADRSRSLPPFLFAQRTARGGRNGSGPDSNATATISPLDRSAHLQPLPTPIAFSGGHSSENGGAGLNAFKSFLSGGFAGALAKTVVAPLDRLKIIFQISHMEFHFRALWRELSRTVEHEGLKALFRGNGAQVLRVYPYSGVQLMTYDRYAEMITRARPRALHVFTPVPSSSPDLLPSSNGNAPHPTHHYRKTSQKARLTGWEKMLAGAAAGATSVVATYPLDLMRARLAVQMETPPPEALRAMASASSSASKGAAEAAASAMEAQAATAAASSRHHAHSGHRLPSGATMLEAAQHMMKTQGFGSFYRGMIPTLLGILPYAGLAFFTFETGKQIYTDLNGGKEPSPFHKMFFGGCAGLVGQACTYPLDIVRRRMQTEGFSPIHAHLTAADSKAGGGSSSSFYKPRPGGMTDTAMRIIRREGIKGLFKGLSLNFVKGPMAVGVSFTTFDLLKRTFDID